MILWTFCSSENLLADKKYLFPCLSVFVVCFMFLLIVVFVWVVVVVVVVAIFVVVVHMLCSFVENKWAPGDSGRLLSSFCGWGFAKLF